ncbi:pca operon transcription factor PcaQ [Paralcaligenes ginsengisoli]
MENNKLDARIKLRHLHCLLAVAQHGSLQKAADALSVTQPAMSKSIAEMENILGVRLFERGRNGARPTSQAEVFLRHANASVSALRQGLDLLSRNHGAAGGTVDIAILPTLAAHLMPPVLKSFRQEWPGMVVQVHTGLNQQLLAMLKTQQVELLIGRVSDPSAMAGLAFEYLFAAPLAIVVRDRHPLLGLASVAASDLIDFHVILPPRGTIIRHMADSFLLSHGLGALADYSEILSVSLGRAMTLNNDNIVWFVPEIAVRGDLRQSRLHTLPLDMSGTEEPIGLIQRSDTIPTPPVQTLIGALRTVIGLL